MPANTGMFFNLVSSLAAFDILDIEGLFQISEVFTDILNLLPTDPVNEKFETVGFESTYFTNNLGTFTLIILGKLLMILVWLTLKLLSKVSSWADRKRKKLGKRIFWNSWILAIQESFIIVLLCSAITIKYDLAFDTSG